MSLQLAITVTILADVALIDLTTLVMSRAKLLTPYESAAGPRDRQAALPVS
jgi:hypothetical protein